MIRWKTSIAYSITTSGGSGACQDMHSTGALGTAHRALPSLGLRGLLVPPAAGHRGRSPLRTSGRMHALPPAAAQAIRANRGFGVVSGRSGSLLIITLWIVTILSALAVAVARYLSVEIRVAKYEEARQKAMALARSGVYLAMERLEQDANEEGPLKDTDWLGDDWAQYPENIENPDTWVILASPSGEGESVQTISIQISDENRKLNINSAKEEVLTRLLVALNVPDAQGLADYILDYREDTGKGDEGSLPYFPKHAKFAAIEELHDIPEVDDIKVDDTISIYAQLREHLTPYTKTDTSLNINTVTEEVMEALGVTVDGIADVMKNRNDPEKAPFLKNDLLNALENELGLSSDDVTILNALNTSSQVFTVTSEASLESPSVHARVEAVVGREGTCVDGQTCIIAWRQG